MECPTLAPVIAFIAAASIGRVTHEVGIVVQGSLIEREELMTLNPTVIRALQLRIDTHLSIADGLLHTGLVIGTTESTVFLDLCQTVSTVEEAPTQ